MYTAFVLAALTVATANAGLIGAPWATSIVGARTISLASPIAAAPIGLGLSSPLIGRSIISGPAIASPLGLGGLGIGSPLLGKSILAGPGIVGSVGLASPLAAGPILRAW